MVPPIRTRRQGSCQASAGHLEQCAEFLPLRNRGLGPLAVTVLSIPFARRATATACAAVQSTAPLFRRRRPAGLSALGPRLLSQGTNQARRGYGTGNKWRSDGVCSLTKLASVEVLHVRHPLFGRLRWRSRNQAGSGRRGRNGSRVPW